LGHEQRLEEAFAAWLQPGLWRENTNNIAKSIPKAWRNFGAVSKQPSFPQDKLFIILHLSMVEAAGVEPATRVENTQLTDSENASNAENATISKSAVQSLYKHCLKFPELQPSDFPLGARAL
jgi:hypothetical protein